MPSEKYAYLFEPKPEISEGLEELIAQMNIGDLHEVSDLPEKDIDFLLSQIKVETKSKQVLMDYVREIAQRENITGAKELYNLKIKVLLDNLAKKMCRCVNNAKGNYISKTAVCRKSVFQKRGVDFYTYHCEPNEKNPRRSPRLNPKKGTNMILHKYESKSTEEKPKYDKTCSGLRKSGDNACEKQDECQWVKGKGCQRRASAPAPVAPPKKSSKKCYRHKKAVCEETAECQWVKGKGCKEMISGGGIFSKKSPKQKREFYIHDNGGKPFLVYLESDNSVSVYRAHITKDEDIDYQQLIANIQYAKIWIPEGYNRDMLGKRVKGSRDLYIDSALEGNTILLQKTDGKMVYIGESIYEFSLEKGDSVVAYYSPVGRNDVPYPVLVGRSGVYFMNDSTYVPMNHFSKITDEKEFIDAYSYYYGHKGESSLKRVAKKMRDIKIIHKRHLY